MRAREGHLEDTIDRVVLGYYAGEGKRDSLGIGAFLVITDTIALPGLVVFGSLFGSFLDCFTFYCK